MDPPYQSPPLVEVRAAVEVEAEAAEVEVGMEDKLVLALRTNLHARRIRKVVVAVVELEAAARLGRRRSLPRRRCRQAYLQSA